MFYEAIAGARPFAAASPLATLNRIRNVEPASPRQLNPAVDRDLETICLRCLSKDAESRYASAAALADNLERWIRGEPILARHVGPAEQCWKWVRRRPLTDYATLEHVRSFADFAKPIQTARNVETLLVPQIQSGEVSGVNDNSWP
jgi:serine/threonine protein kinase